MALLGNILAPLCFAAEHGETVRRDVLALYDGGTESRSDETLIHKLAEMPLNYLGYVVRYRDVRDPLLGIEDLNRYAAVLTWFEVPIAKPKPYLEWAARAMASGTRFIVLGEAGGNPYSSDIRLINNLLSHLSLRHIGQFVDTTFGSRVVRKDGTYFEFERPIDVVLPPFPIIREVADTHVMLEIEPADRTLYQRSVLAVVGPKGGFVARGYIHYYDTSAHRLKWILNPFTFFRAALGSDVKPIPDVTTLSGRRMYFSHVDGNGWNNAVQIPGYRENKSVAAEVFENEIVAKFPDFPVTVSVIGGDLDRRYGGIPASSEIAKRIFAFQHVEIGVHTFTQPLVWKAFDPQGNEGSIADKSKGSDRRGLMAWLSGRDSLAAGSASPVSLSNRTFPQGAFDLDTEITKAITAAKELAPEGKQVAIYTWTGDNKPFEQAIKATRAAGIRNINGGDSRFNASFPSIAYVSPISRTVGHQRQIYAGANNESYSLDEMAQPNYAFSNFTETSRNTGSPRRLKPVNLYYSVHSAERTATLNAVQSHLGALRKEPLIPVRASEYSAIADGFFDVEISAIGALSWKLSNRGALQTIRFDEADLLELDPERSHGAIAQTRFQNSLFIGLDAAVEEPIVSLRRKGSASGTVPTLAESRWSVRSVHIKPCEVHFTAEGFGKGEFSWTGFEPGQYRVDLRNSAGALWHGQVDVAQDRRLQFTAPVSGIAPVAISVQCGSAENGGG